MGAAAEVPLVTRAVCRNRGEYGGRIGARHPRQRR